MKNHVCYDGDCAFSHPNCLWDWIGFYVGMYLEFVPIPISESSVVHDAMAVCFAHEMTQIS